MSTEHIDYICPKCDSDLAVGFTQQEVVCPHCKTDIVIHYDADYENGRWIDCTKLQVKGE